MDISELSYLKLDSGYFRIEIYGTGTVDFSEFSFVGLG